MTWGHVFFSWGADSTDDAGRNIDEEFDT